MKLQRCYRFRLDPTPAQELAFRQFAGCRRYVWNWALGRKRAVYQETGASLSYGELAAELVALKRVTVLWHGNVRERTGRRGEWSRERG